MRGIVLLVLALLTVTSLGTAAFLTRRRSRDKQHGRTANVDRRFYDLVAGLDQVVIESDAENWTVSFVSPRAIDLLGYPAERWRSSPQFWESLVHPDDRESVGAAFALASTTQRDFELDYRMQSAAGATLWIHQASRLHRDRAGGRPCYETVLSDISERKRGQEDLSRSLALLRATLDATADGILVVDSSGTITGFNRVFAEMWNIPDSVLDANEDSRALSYVLDQLSDPDGFVAKVKDLYADPDAESVDIVEFKDGRQFERYSRPQRVGKLAVGRVWSFRDMTVRKRAEKALRASEQSFRETLENMQLLALALDSSGAVTFCNDYLLEVIGYSRAELLGRSWFALAMPHDHDAGRDFIASLADGLRPSHLEVTLRTRRDEERIVVWSMTPLRNTNGAAVGAVAIGEDVTEARFAEEALRANEEQLRQAQKMEAVGRLAGGVAHDFNNILTAIAGYTDFMLSQLEPESPLHRDAEEIQRAIERATTLTRQLLAFSRRQVLQPAVLDPNSVVADIEKLLRRLIGEDIELLIPPSSERGWVHADRGQLEQVLVNLAVNARDAMPDGGQLTIESAIEVLGDEIAGAGGPIAAGRYVTLTVSDTGTGIPPEVREHLFEPFFTTKEPGKGTGLGLATVYGIVKQSGGEVVVAGETGEGATFRVYLPCVEEPVIGKPVEVA